MNRAIACIAAVLIVSGCGSSPKPQTAETPAPKAKPKPADESRRFPAENRIDSSVHDVIWNKTFMPGGTVATYRKGKTDYEMFVAKLPNPTEAAIQLLNWKRAMSDTKLIPSFGGYFGQDAGTPVFVFSKGDWLAGIRGLSEKEADAQARVLASRLN